MVTHVANTSATTTTRAPTRQTQCQRRCPLPQHEPREKRRSRGTWSFTTVDPSISPPITDIHSCGPWRRLQSSLMLTSAERAAQILQCWAFPGNGNSPPYLTPCTHLSSPKPDPKVWKRWLLHQMWRDWGKATRNEISRKYNTIKEHSNFPVTGPTEMEICELPKNSNNCFKKDQWTTENTDN